MEEGLDSLALLTKFLAPTNCCGFRGWITWSFFLFFIVKIKSLYEFCPTSWHISFYVFFIRQYHILILIISCVLSSSVHIGGNNIILIPLITSLVANDFIREVCLWSGLGRICFRGPSNTSPLHWWKLLFIGLKFAISFLCWPFLSSLSVSRWLEVALPVNHHW